MSTEAQTAANIANAQSSTGPRTPEGKAISAKNSVVHGLFSGDFVRPGEESIYTILRGEILRDLAPVGAIEDLLTEEIYRAAWRLRRCGDVENRFVTRLDDGKHFIQDPMEGASSNCERIQHSVDRASAQSHRIFHKCTAELRKPRAERKAASPAESIKSPEETPDATRTQSEPAETTRNTECPGNSGLKVAQGCGNDAPPDLCPLKQAA